MAVLVAVLGLLSAYHLAKGTYYLAIQSPPAGVYDLGLRVTESRYLVDHVWPQSQYLFDEHSNDALGALAERPDPTHRHGTVILSGLAPWSYVPNLAFYPPLALSTVRVEMIAVDLLALGVLAFVMARQFTDTNARMLAAVSVTAIGAIDNCMTGGQNAIFVTASVALVLLVLQSEPGIVTDGFGGVAAAIAFSKPTIGALFALPAVFRRRPVVTTVGVILTAASWIAASTWTGVPMMLQWRQFVATSVETMPNAANPLLLAMMHATGSAALARDVLVAAGAALALAGAIRFRGDAVDTFAWLAFAARIWTYHRPYDDVMMAFLLIALLRRALAQPSAVNQFLWMMCGASLWLPYSLYISPVMQTVQLTAWTVGACALWRR